MKRRDDQYDYMDLDDVEELLADQPRGEKWELIGGRVGRDRVEKWRTYQKLPSLWHHVLVERDKPVIEVFARAGEAWFKLRMVEGLDATLDLSALDVTIPLAEIYRDVLSA